jgi:glycosyltransferase involved in cell wall biosynthesis
MARPTVSAVMSTYNRRELLPLVVPPLLADEGLDELVVIVDGSRDGSFELLEELRAGDARLKSFLIENRGKEGARQEGVERATGEVVVLLDDDVLAGPGLVSGHARHHAETGGLVVIGYMPVDREPADAHAGATALYADEYEDVARQYEQDPELVLRKLWGGNLSLRRADALRVGLVSADYGASYHQDRDFGLRCHEAGLRGRFDRSLRATHLHRRPLGAFLRDARAQGAGLRQLYELHPGELGPFDPGSFASGLPAPVAAWVRASRRPRVLRASTAALEGVAAVASALRVSHAATLALKVMRRMHQQAGALSPGA